MEPKYKINVWPNLSKMEHNELTTRQRSQWSKWWLATVRTLGSSDSPNQTTLGRARPLHVPQRGKSSSPIFSNGIYKWKLFFLEKFDRFKKWASHLNSELLCPSKTEQWDYSCPPTLCRTLHILLWKAILQSHKYHMQAKMTEPTAKFRKVENSPVRRATQISAVRTVYGQIVFWELRKEKLTMQLYDAVGSCSMMQVVDILRNHDEVFALRLQTFLTFNNRQVSLNYAICWVMQQENRCDANLQKLAEECEHTNEIWLFREAGFPTVMVELPNDRGIGSKSLWRGQFGRLVLAPESPGAPKRRNPTLCTDSRA